MYKPKTLPIIGAALLLIASFALFAIGSPDFAIACSMASVGIVINGVETDSEVSLEKLQTMRNDAVKAMGELRDKFHSRSAGEGQPGSWEGEERKQWEDVNAHIKAIDARMKQLRSSADIDAAWNDAQENEQRDQRDRQGGGRDGGINDPNRGQRENAITPEVRNLALQGWLLNQRGGRLSENQRNALEQVGEAANVRDLDMRMLDGANFSALTRAARSGNQADLVERLQQRAMSIAPSGLGSELIPQGFINQVEINQLAYGSVMMVADMLRTSGGNQIPWPTMNDVGNKGRIIGENTCVNTTPDPVTGQILFGAYKFTSDAILVPYELLEDEAVAPMLPQILSRMLGERLGRIKEEKYTIGTGNGEPQGIVTASTLGLTTAGPALSPDDIISLEHSVDPAYRNGAAYMMHDSIIEAVRLLKDNEGRYLWRAGLQDGRPDMLNGRSVYVNQEMDDTLTTGNKAMLFGQFSNFKIREVNNMRMYRLLERFRDCDQDAFLAFCRGDSRLITAGTPSVVHLLVG